MRERPAGSPSGDAGRRRRPRGRDAAHSRAAPGSPALPASSAGSTRSAASRAVVQVVTGAQHTCAAHDDGRISCWGLAESINAGGGYVVPPSFLPEPRDPLALAAGIAAHLRHHRRPPRALLGQPGLHVSLEDGAPLDGVDRPSPWAAPSAAPPTARGSYCWGKNDLGQLARPPEVDASSQALLAQAGASRFLGAGLAVVSPRRRRSPVRLGAQRHPPGDRAPTPSTSTASRSAAPLPDVVQLAVGADHACVRHAAGTFSCWGERYYGQLGLGGRPATPRTCRPSAR